VVFTTFLAKRIPIIAKLIAIGFTHAMAIIEIPKGYVWALYYVPMMRPVTHSRKGSYQYRFPAFDVTNCSLASLESFLY
jgi:hypothetical protein